MDRSSNLDNPSDPTTPENTRFAVDLRGVVDLLSTALYSNRRVYLRELLQNSTDAIMARRDQNPQWTTRGIVISPSSEGDPEFRVTDDGKGLTEEELYTFLSTVGSSSKRNEFGMPGSAMGRFGIGMLSAFMVTDEIRVHTRSSRGGAPLEWVGRSDGTFSVRSLPGETDALPVGTTLSFIPRHGDRDLTNRIAVLELVRHYARYLPVAIRLEDAAESLTEEPPFLSEDGETALDYGRDLIGAPPLAAVPIDIPLTGTHGVAYVLPHPAVASQGDAHTVYCSRMLVSTECRGIAPPWAFFTRICLNSTGLNPTASRESLADDETLRVTREAVSQVLRGWLQDQHETNPEGFAAFVRIHYLGLKQMAIHDPEIGPLLIRYIPLETSRGLKPLGELLEHSTELRFVADTDQYRQVMALTSGTSTIVNAAYTWDRELLRRVPELLPSVQVTEVTVADVIDQLDDVHPSDRAVTQRFSSRVSAVLQEDDADCAVRLAATPDVPTFLLTDPDILRRTERKTAAKSAAPAWSTVIKTLDRVAGERESAASTTVLFNWSNPLVRQIASIEDEPVFARSVRMLHLQAVLASGRPLSAAQSRRLTETMTDLMILGMGN